MLGFQIKNVLGIASDGCEAVKKIGYFFIGIPIRILKTIYRIQIKMIYLPFRLFRSLHAVMFKRNSPRICDKGIQATPETVEQESCDRLVCESSGSTDEMSIHETSQSEQESIQEASDSQQDSVNEDLSLEALYLNQSIPILERPRDYYTKYIAMVREESLKKIADLPNAIERYAEAHMKAEENSGGSSLVLDDVDNAALDLRSSTQSRKDRNGSEDATLIRSIQRDAEYLTKYARLPEKNKRSFLSTVELDSGGEGSLDSSRESMDSENENAKLHLDKPIEFNAMLNSEDKFHKLGQSATVSPTSDLSIAVRSLQDMQYKREKLNLEYNSIARNILSKTVPAVKQAIRALNLSGEESEVKSDLENLKTPKHEPARRNLDFQDTNEKEITFHVHQLLHVSIEVLHSLVDIITQEIVFLKRRLSSTNNKMAEITRSSDNLFEEMSKINVRFNMLINLSTNVTNLQHELGEDHKILKEVEADRHEMKLKLLALEKLIKEEEEYLDDVSIESGYDDYETPATSPYKHKRA